MIQLLTVTKFTFYNQNPNIHKKCNHIIRLKLTDHIIPLQDGRQLAYIEYGEINELAYTLSPPF
ncbi:hypothetical protein [Bacillus cereus]|uniref:hypothetical protein n=1 Tax=Bacillus cereus TaxID=1396 RepID=UPI0015CF189D|nr:hypothetical protein [Bacillus cereus]